MILGFRANINEDSHRIFITRLQSNSVKFYGKKSLDNENYSFIFNSVEDFKQAEKIKNAMLERYPNVPMHNSI